MDLTHRFTVPTAPADAWAAFTDLRRIGGCLPGATITSVDGDDFTGTVKIKLGPISLQYNGSGSYVEKDEAAGRVVIEAKGKDKRGNGTASARITGVLTPADGGTDVEVCTDLTITGKPAQFGRGVIQDVSDALIGQFVECVKDKLGGTDRSGASDVAGSDAAEPASADPTGSTAESLVDNRIGAANTPDITVVSSGQVSGELRPLPGGRATDSFPKSDAPTAAAAGDPLQPAERPTPKTPSAEATEPSSKDSAGTGSGASPTPAPISGPSAPEIDLFSTVGPVLAKRFGKPAIGALAVFVGFGLIRRLVTRR